MKKFGYIILATSFAFVIIALLWMSRYLSATSFYTKLAETLPAMTENSYLKDTDEHALASSEPSFCPAEPDWDYLKTINPDIIAWIWLPDNSSYPVTQCDNNYTYLDKGFDLNNNMCGCLFADMGNEAFSDRNTIIYGHNMRNGSMFGNNDYLLEEAYFNEHQYFYIYTASGDFYTYKIINVMVVEDRTLPYSIITANDDNTLWENWLEEMNALSIYDTEYNTNNVVTLSTCKGISSSKRLVIQGQISQYHRLSRWPALPL